MHRAFLGTIYAPGAVGRAGKLEQAKKGQRPSESAMPGSEGESKKRAADESAALFSTKIAENEKGLLAMTYSPRKLPSKYHRRCRA